MVLELTLKHVKALSGILEQQQQKIMALQNDLQIGEFDVVCACKITNSCRPLSDLLPLSELLQRKLCCEDSF